MFTFLLFQEEVKYMDEKIIFVKVELLSNEDSFEALKRFFTDEKENKIDNYYSLDLDLSKNKIVTTKYDDLFKHAMLSLVGQQPQNGYMLIQVKYLKKYLLGL